MKSGDTYVAANWGEQGFMWWFVVCSAPSHYLKQSVLTNRKSNISVQLNAFTNALCKMATMLLRFHCVHWRALTNKMEYSMTIAVCTRVAIRSIVIWGKAPRGFIPPQVQLAKVGPSGGPSHSYFFTTVSELLLWFFLFYPNTFTFHRFYPRRNLIDKQSIMPCWDGGFINRNNS